LGKNLTTLVWSLPVVAIGLGVPAFCVYFTVQGGLHWIATLVISCAAVLAAGLLGIVEFGILSRILTEEDTGADDRLRTLRASQRATLEEMDRIEEILTEIRDALRAVGE